MIASGSATLPSDVVVGVDLFLGRELAVELHRPGTLACCAAKLPASPRRATVVVGSGRPDILKRHAVRTVRHLETPRNRRFCGSCGAALAAACRRCRLRQRAGDRLLRRVRRRARRMLIARNVSPERRQVAVLFADLVGYTALTGELGAEEVQALLDRSSPPPTARRASTAAGSTSTSATASWRVFGAPVAHGNDAERAVRARSRSAPPCRSRRAVGREAAGPCRRRRRRGGGERHRERHAPRVHRHGRDGEPGRAADRPRGAGRDPGLRRGAAGALGDRSGSSARRARAVKGLADRCGAPPDRRWRAPAGLGRRPARRPRRASSTSSGGLLGPRRRRGARWLLSCAARPGSARPAWSRSSERRAAGRGFACHVGLGARLRRAPGPGRHPGARRAGCSASTAGRRGPEREARCGARALADGLVAGRRRVPQRPARPAAAGGAAPALRRDGQRGRNRGRRETVAGSSGRAPGSHCCWSSRTCTGRTGYAGGSGRRSPLRLRRPARPSWS